MPGRRSTQFASLVAAVVACAVLLSACGSSGFHYVKSSEDKTYFKVPSNWKLYDNDALFEAAKADMTAADLESARQNQWAAIFDAHPKPALSHVTSRSPSFPVGRALVEKISAEAADGVSLSSLRNLFYNIDTKVQNETATVLTYEPVERDGGFHGSHLVATLKSSKGESVLNQITLLDQATSKVYAIAIKCSTKCYEKNKSKIEQVIDSWTVKAD
ncbi:MAG: hypothetical protein ABW211_01650 [Acidimicrobiia bacterium]